MLLNDTEWRASVFFLERWNWLFFLLNQIFWTTDRVLQFHHFSKCICFSTRRDWTNYFCEDFLELQETLLLFSCMNWLNDQPFRSICENFFVVKYFELIPPHSQIHIANYEWKLYCTIVEEHVHILKHSLHIFDKHFQNQQNILLYWEDFPC